VALHGNFVVSREFVAGISTEVPCASPDFQGFARVLGGWHGSCNRARAGGKTAVNQTK